MSQAAAAASVAAGAHADARIQAEPCLAVGPTRLRRFRVVCGSFCRATFAQGTGDRAAFFETMFEFIAVHPTPYLD